MIGLIILLCLILVAILAVQIGKVSELAGLIKGDKEVEEESNRFNGALSMVFLVVFLVACVVSAGYYKNSFLGYGPLTSASEHGFGLDYLFNVTLFFTGIVFIATHIALFYFAYKYSGRSDRQATYISHNNKLEYIWSGIPAIVMTFLVVTGLVEWNEVMSDVGLDEDYIEIEATGFQFGWILRYPGPDGILGEKNYKKITSINPLGQDWDDVKNLDDIVTSGAGEMLYLPLDKKVRVRITSRDVLHNFYLPHFRVKMDAIPGIPTYFVFTPTTTTDDFREQLKGYKEFDKINDIEEPDGPTRAEAFEFELACAELCGKGHYSMRRMLKIVEEPEYNEWLTKQNSWYLQNVRNSDEDPYKGMLLDVELADRKKNFAEAFNTALAATDDDSRILRLNHVNFQTGSDVLTPNSKYQLDNLIELLSKHGELKIELAGHTDNTGVASENLALSKQRAQVVDSYLSAHGISESRLKAEGYGQSRPIQSNDTPEGRADNRRTEIKLLR